MQLPREDSQPPIFSLFGGSITTPPDPCHLHLYYAQSIDLKNNCQGGKYSSENAYIANIFEGMVLMPLF